MSAEGKFQAKYSDCLENFKELSYDGINNESLCQNTVYKYYNFDKIVKKEDNNSGRRPASPDALIFKGRTIYCVEFKNSFEESVREKSIQNKLKGGYHVLSGIFTELKLKITNYKLIFCVVYKVSKRNRKRRSTANSYSFSLKKYGFNEVITNDVSFFRQQFIEKIGQNLSC
ncbi:hypothetical protein BPUTSESOX_1820 [uncultured Gammaproteobacteria bacterium]|jgi:hypothetical protein|nr:hypothetical protein [uncultured Gammaproteobacteria bacterium]CAC9958115.1 hypothetical protein [uncultured Gammaproteobacteria bacterium]VVH52446.1 hypothetical protein BPUTSESOX_1820 [uncultured Gammaproteobacteria bacterium]